MTGTSTCNKRTKGAAKKVVARVKAEAIEELYTHLETSE